MQVYLNPQYRKSELKLTQHKMCGVSFESSWWARCNGRTKTCADWFCHSSKIEELCEPITAAPMKYFFTNCIIVVIVTRPERRLFPEVGGSWWLLPGRWLQPLLGHTRNLHCHHRQECPQCLHRRPTQFPTLFQVLQQPKDRRKDEKRWYFCWFTYNLIFLSYFSHGVSV